ncbi:amidohydrolase family protein [Silvanigrella paludirubra]|uniref:Amidohydrolase family protein n=1 Tax=Silvanigrella paludirubra TaxID=2499159 RepID=A0A6N6VTQ9_9BACT|nr:amidohydrolase family protein [Silvanigrella paludirubra]KAB8039041.1 amidohydrolase family protein [Silvanigrella paludirubra]
MNCNEIIFSKKILLKEGALYKIFPASIEISGNHIHKVTKLSLESYQESLSKEKHLKKVTIHDFGDRLITPSFINSHTHIAMNFFRSFFNTNSKPNNLIEDIFYKAESLLTPSDVRAFSRIGAFENILNGNGLIWDHYYYGEEIAKACLETGIGAVIAPTLQDISGPGVAICRKMLDETYKIHSNHLYENSGIYAAFGPHATDTVSESLWKEILEGSKELNIPIHAHIAQSYEEINRIYKKHKTTPIQFLNSLGILKNPSSNLFIHGIYLNKKDFKLLQSKNNALVFCPFSQMIFQFPANIIDWYKNKLKWFVATDCVASNDSMNLQKELKMVSGFPSLQNTFSNHLNLIEKYTQKNKTLFLKEKSNIKKIQIKFADSSFLLNKVFEGPGTFHNHFKAGIIQQGALANLNIWDLNHPSMWPSDNIPRNLSMGDTTGAIYNMMICGKWISNNGNFIQSILESDIYKMSLKEANDRLRYLLKKI